MFRIYLIDEFLLSNRYSNKLYTALRVKTQERVLETRIIQLRLSLFEAFGDYGNGVIAFTQFHNTLVSFFPGSEMQIFKRSNQTFNSIISSSSTIELPSFDQINQINQINGFKLFTKSNKCEAIIELESSHYIQLIGDENLAQTIDQIEDIIRKFGDFFIRAQTVDNQSGFIAKLVESNRSPQALIKNGKFLKVNHAFCKLISCKESDIIDHPVETLFSDNKEEHVGRKIKAVLSKQINHAEIVCDIKFRTKEQRRVLCTLVDLSNELPRIEVCLMNLTDLEALITDKETLKKSNNILENTIAKSSSAIDIIQFNKSDKDFKDGKLFSRNDRMEKYLGKTKKPFYDKELFLLLAPTSTNDENTANEIYDRIYQNIKDHKISYDEIKIQIKKGEQKGQHLYFFCIHQLVELDEVNILIRTFRDITQEKKEEILMRNQKITLDAILDSSLDGIYALDKNYKVIAINKKAKKDFLDIENLKVDIGSDFKELVDKDTLDLWNKNYFNAVFEGKSTKYIGEAKLSDGTIRYVENQYSPVISPNGEVYACLELSRDITDLYAKEVELVKSESKYKNLVETSTAGIVQTDEDGIIQFASHQASVIHGMKPADMVGKHCLNFIHDKAIEAGASIINKLLHEKQEVNFTSRANHIDPDKKLYLDVKASFVKNEDKGQFLLTYFDVSDKVITEYELNKTRASFDLLYKNTTNPVFLYDNSNDKFKMANRAAVDLLGYTEQEFSNMSWDTISEFDPNLFETENLETQPEEKPKNNKVLISKTGSKHFCEVSFLSANAKGTEDFIVINDNTDQIEKNNELKRYIESNLQLENFAYIASHDLKAPLRTVSSFAHLLKSNSYDSLDEKGKSFLNIVLDNSVHMQLLIDDLLEFSRINTQDTKIRKLNLNKLMLRVVSQLKSTLEETNTKLTYDKLPEVLHGDESMLIQLFQNLIGNSIKFVSKGVVPEIHISYKELTEHHQFCLKDNGIGISKKDIESIFKIFKKLHNQDSYAGTGLGLTICKRIVEKHFGKIWIESELNNGSEFYFTILKRKPFIQKK